MAWDEAALAVADPPRTGITGRFPVACTESTPWDTCTLRECVEDLESKGQVVRIEQPIDPNLEAAEIQRRVFQAGGPVI